MKQPTLLEIVKTALYIGVVGYGGPAIIAPMKKIIVHEKAWVSEEEFMRQLSLARPYSGRRTAICHPLAGELADLGGFSCFYALSLVGEAGYLLADFRNSHCLIVPVLNAGKSLSTGENRYDPAILMFGCLCVFPLPR